ncbi:MAG: alpha/beta hydrolase [Acidimicrobiia bacterium]|nr:alpha/beta hydrolase [Acidimicrobiia bacterium]
MKLPSRPVFYSALAVVFLAISGGMLCENAMHIPASFRKVDPEAWVRGLGVKGEHVEIRSGDGYRLRGTLFRPREPNGAAVIGLHGVADWRRGVTGQASLLLRHNYTVLAPDSRGHGLSEGEPVTYGVKERDDVRRWTEWLVERTGSPRLYGFGQSMGAAILAEATAVQPRFRAIVADSCFYDFLSIGVDRLGANRLLAAPFLYPALMYARVRYGVNLTEVSPVAALGRSRTPALLIHGSRDNNIRPWHSQRLHEAHPEFTQLWQPEADHVNAVALHGAEYERQVVEWLSLH